MERGRRLLQCAVIVWLAAAIPFFGTEARAEKGPRPAAAAASAHPDLIKIDTLAAYQKLELPAVTFHHDKHTKALRKEGKDCQACHLVEAGKLSLAYMRQKGTKPAALKDIYHANCIGCHMEEAAAGKETGPPDGLCRDCHNARPEVAAARLDAGFGQVLHFRHTNTKLIPKDQQGQDNCGRCHHELDPKTKKLFYAKGKEETCRYCHLAKEKKGVKSLQEAAHLQCVLCHLDSEKRGMKEHVPYDCAGCHGAAAQAQTAKKDREVVAALPNKEVPRLKRGQPDAVLVTHDPKFGEGKPGKPRLMDPVAFDHRAHEKYNDTCRVCHHASMEPCEKCHTLLGTKEGGYVNFEKAMHSLESQTSCQGCHAVQQAAADCAGCHNYIKKPSRPEDANCRLCHLWPEGISLPGGATRVSALSPPQKASLAEDLLKTRNMNPGTYPLKDIPETVEIKDLANRFQPSEFTHRKHMAALLKDIKGNKLAAYFHHDPGILCQGCHHYSPPAKEPPRCGNCHGGESLLPREANQPALLAAMHQQCMGCHTDMRLKKPAATACTECHKEKQK